MKTSIPWFIGFIAYLFLMLVAPLTQFFGWFPSLKSDHHLLLALFWMITVVFALILGVLFVFGFALFLKTTEEETPMYDDYEFLDDESLD